MGGYYWNLPWIYGMSVRVFRGVALMITVMDVQVLYKAGNGLAVWTNFMFTRRTSLREVTRINLQTQQLWDRLKLLDSTCIQEDPGERSRYSDSLRAGRSGDRIPVGARYSTPVQTCLTAHPTSRTMGTESLSRGFIGRGVALTTHPI